MTSQSTRSSAKEFPSSSGKHPLEDNPSDTGRVPEILVERAALGELPPDKLAATRARIEADPEASALYEGLEASNAEVLALYSPNEMADAIQRRERVSRVESEAQAQLGRRPMRLMWVPALAAVAAGLLAVFLIGPTDNAARDTANHRGGSQQEVTRDKGLEPRLIVHRKTAQGSEALAQDQATRESDLIQVKYVAAGHPHGVIVSLDGAGAATLHFPEEVRGDTALVRSGEVSLPHSYKLDDAPHFERFFFVTGQRPIDVEEVMAASRRLAQDSQGARRDPLALPEGLKQVSFSVKKVKP